MRVFLVEDHPVFRLGLKELIEQEEDLVVCGEADDIPKALVGVEKSRPDLVVVDISLQGRSGLELVKALADLSPPIPTLVLSMHEESVYAERSLRTGAKGYIMKHETSESIIQALRTVLSGEVYLSTRMASLLIGKLARGSGAQSPGEALTNREMEVFVLMGRGLTTKEISDKLCLSPKTVGTYRERIKEKLGHKNSIEMQRHAVQWVEAERYGKSPD